jgi:NitT/TauT family transport system permease protein
MERRRLIHPIMVAIALFSMLLIWWPLSLVSTRTFFPGPIIVFSEVWDIVVSGEFIKPMCKTILRILFGFTSSMLISVIVGWLISTGGRTESFLKTYISVGLTVPALAWSIIAVMWLGLNDFAAIFAIIVLTVPMITQNIVQGIKNVDKQLLEMAEIFRINRPVILRSIVLPQLLPYILSASRYGIGLAWKTVVIVEMLGLSDGAGYMIAHSFSSFSMKRVLAWTVLFTLTMLLIEYGILERIENRLTRWRPKITI